MAEASSSGPVGAGLEVIPVGCDRGEDEGQETGSGPSGIVSISMMESSGPTGRSKGHILRFGV